MFTVFQMSCMQFLRIAKGEFKKCDLNHIYSIPNRDNMAWIILEATSSNT